MRYTHPPKLLEMLQLPVNSHCCTVWSQVLYVSLIVLITQHSAPETVSSTNVITDLDQFYEYGTFLSSYKPACQAVAYPPHCTSFFCFLLYNLLC